MASFKVIDMKNKILTIFFFGFSLISIIGFGQSGSDNSKDVKDITDVIVKYKVSINLADTLLGAAIFANVPEITFIHPKGHEKGWSGIKKGIYGLFRESFSSRDLKISDENISVYGNTAVAEFYWVFDAIFKGENPSPLQTNGRETQVLRKFGKDWRIVHVHYSGMPVSGERQGF